MTTDTATDVATTDPAAVLRSALTSLEQLAQVHDRPELAEAAQAASRRLHGTALRVVVMGEYKQGKSSLINALIDAPVCAVDDDLATAARLEVGYAESAGARRWLRADGEATIEAIDISASEAADASTDEATTLIRVGLPRRLLRAGLVLVDTPGVGGIGSAASVVTASSLADAHAVLFVTDASQELTRAEVDALADAAQRCPHLIVVETKTDVYPAWRDIVDADRGHLAELGLDLPVVAVATPLRLRALRAESRELNEESGYPDLMRRINDFVRSARDVAHDGAVHTARRVYAHLREPLASELEALELAADAEQAKQNIAGLREEITAFRQRVNGWQQVLSDGVTDLAAAVELDLRDRFRTLVKDADEQLEDSDPDEVWHEFEPELYRRTAEALDENLTLLREHAVQLAERLADAIADDEATLVDVTEQIGNGAGLDETAERREAPNGSSGARAQQAFRAGYGGAMPIMAVGGMALGVLGLGTLVLPLAAVAGVMAGRKALTDERQRRLSQRRQQAKVAVKRYTDQALFRSSAERKQAQRNVQRALRDHFGARVKELAATHQQRFERAEAAAAADEQERRRRMATVIAELTRIEDVARAMAGGS